MPNNEGEYMHNNGSINPSEVATLSLLGGGHGYGLGSRGRYFGDEVLAAQSHADGTAVNARVESTEKNVDLQGDRMRDLLRDRQFNDLSVALGSVREELARVNGDNRVEIQTVLREIQRGECELAKQIAECCCETQKETISQGNATRELVNQRALDDAQRALDRADRENNTAQIVAAIRENSHNHYYRGGVNVT